MKTKLFFLSFFISALCFSQQTIAATGGNATGSGGSFSFTVGQVDYLPFQGGNTKITPGVQQPFEIQAYLGIEITDVNLEMSVYPNPTTDVLNLSVEKHKFSAMEYALFDASGKLLRKEKLKAATSQIVMQDFSSSIYILQVSENGTPLKSFKIIKK